MKIRDQIRIRREALGMSKGELAERLGVSITAVDHWEAGRNAPGKSTGRRLEEELDFQLDWREGVAGPESTAAEILGAASSELLSSLTLLPRAVHNASTALIVAFQEAIEEARKEGFREGQEEGYAAGLRDGRARAPAYTPQSQRQPAAKAPAKAAAKTPAKKR